MDEVPLQAGRLLGVPTELSLLPSPVQIILPKSIYTRTPNCRPTSRLCSCRCHCLYLPQAALTYAFFSYLPTYPLLCLAANYSQRAYTKPTGEEREAFVNADWRMGTKAMVIKSVPIDDMNCVVFAIRGSQTFMDWAVNLNSAPVSPTDFLVRRYQL